MLETLEILRRISVISSLENEFSEVDIMKRVICPVCNSICIKYGKNKSGSQRWFCKECSSITTPQIDNNAKQLEIFLKWLFGRDIQGNMPGSGRTFRRKTSKFWDIWAMPPLIESQKDVVYVDGIYLGRKACVLICCDEKHVLGWYLCRYENSRAWMALLSRIAEPKMVVSDGGKGFSKALKKVWSNAKHQRCLFHVFCQVKRYTTTRPKTRAGAELYAIAKDLMHLVSIEESNSWTERFINWMKKYNKFLSEMTRDENGNMRYTHERLVKAKRSLVKLINEKNMFTYLDETLNEEINHLPSTNNQIEGGINSRLRAMLRDHRGLPIDRQMKAVFWWCYMHSHNPLSASEILKVMPTDQSIAKIYQDMNEREKFEKSINMWGDAVVWGELHKSSNYPVYWD